MPWARRRAARCPDAASLYASTIVMAAGVSIMQPALPPLVRAWFPERIGFATAVYTNGLLIGETLAVSLTIPLVLPLVGNSWRLNFVVWSIPVLLTALLVVVCVSRFGGAAAANGGPTVAPTVGQAALVAGLAPADDLAARPDPRQRQRDVFRHQRLPARLHDGGRPARSDRAARSPRSIWRNCRRPF